MDKKIEKLEAQVANLESMLQNLVVVLMMAGTMTPKQYARLVELVREDIKNDK